MALLPVGQGRGYADGMQPEIATGPTAATAVVRDATPADVPGLDACYACARHAERIAGADGVAVRYLLIESAGVVAGFGRLILSDRRDRSGLNYTPRIVNLNVRPDLQGRGFGSLLIGAMERIARSAGCRALYIGASRDNPRALALYLRLGYGPIPEADRKDVRLHAGADGVPSRRERDAIYVVKSLVDASAANP
ncbi:MAG: hypothetical protein BIFFINMI_01933 [Phycisphaerae bacterium]|nr:hypothetical protein [Phycisphaerae bacterium]